MKDILIVIDIVNSCCHERCESKIETFIKIRKMVPRLVNFISKYKKGGGKVIYLNVVPWKKKNLPKNLVELYKSPQCEYYSKGKTGFEEQFYLVKPQRDDFVITKNNYDAFSSLSFEKLLRKLGVKTLLIAGVFGDGCVESTIQGAFSRGYNLIILRDLIETTDAPLRRKVQNLLVKYTWPVMFGKVINSKCFLKKLK